METVALLTYILTVLIPINGALFLGIRNERIKNHRKLMAMWKMLSR